jgi:hypothetical protein
MHAPVHLHGGLHWVPVGVQLERFVILANGMFIPFVCYCLPTRPPTQESLTTFDLQLFLQLHCGQLCAYICPRLWVSLTCVIRHGACLRHSFFLLCETAPATSYSGCPCVLLISQPRETYGGIGICLFFACLRSQLFNAGALQKDSTEIVNVLQRTSMVLLQAAPSLTNS